MMRNLGTALLAAAFSVAAQSGAEAAKPTLVEQRILTQEGLAIALASTVLQSQLAILVYSEEGSTGCETLTGGTGSAKLISKQTVDSTTYKAVVTVYFDSACKIPYIMANATVTKSSSGITVAETADYTQQTGTALGTMTLNESAFISDAGITGVSGLGQFAPTSGAPTVNLGLECQLPTKSPPPPFPCSGGIAQNFPELKTALASVTPLDLKLKKSGSSYSVSFEGKKSEMVSGALGALSITAPTDTSLGIGGTYKKYGSAATEGSAAQFSLFPPTPTLWSIKDTANDTMFSIAVTSDTTRTSTGTVSQISTGNILATFDVDQSGTGSITYSDKSSEPITSWLLAD
jgi:hypothetical protein